MNPWFLRRKIEKPEFTLYCLPYAGGSAATYIPWQHDCPRQVDISVVQLPGKGARFLEAPITSMNKIVDLLTFEIIKDARQNFAIFGHSMGALIAYEITLKLASINANLPQKLLLSGCSGPDYKSNEKKIHELPFNDFVDQLREYGGTPEEVLDNKELLNLLLPSIRADFELVETYVNRDKRQLNVPISILYGLNDDLIHYESLLEWQTKTTSNFRTYMIKGDHFFIDTCKEEVFNILRSELPILRNT